MVSSKFDFFFDVIQSKRTGVVALKQAALDCEREQLEAWFEFMAMGHPDATEDDRQNAADRLQAAEARLDQARVDLAEAGRRLIIFEDYLRQCSPA